MVERNIAASAWPIFGNDRTERPLERVFQKPTENIESSARRTSNNDTNWTLRIGCVARLRASVARYNNGHNSKKENMETLHRYRPSQFNLLFGIMAFAVLSEHAANKNVSAIPAPRDR